MNHPAFNFESSSIQLDLSPSAQQAAANDDEDFEERAKSWLNNLKAFVDGLDCPTVCGVIVNFSQINMALYSHVYLAK